jgi:hypothetical protein
LVAKQGVPHPKKCFFKIALCLRPPFLVRKKKCEVESLLLESTPQLILPAKATCSLISNKPV